ncbi:hypothetical protein DFH07DRAFT_946424 [Mycena maculata]|uniref:Mitochondrial carrier protein n=1 Tax=Mycena maculata TaxID=230809 RepID=A0AAD7HNS5_9AGAR|nr:hypothetical protein DFH07DRAFT_946424 [Mycena maculata]
MASVKDRTNPDASDAGSAKQDSTDSQGTVQAALARTSTRALALYFSRPVRLFRPTKVSGWHSLRGLAAQDGVSLTPSYISSLIKTQGFTVIPKHFFPPMVVNTLLGTVLWTSYAEASTLLHPHIGSHPTAMATLAGALAGGAQALVSAPADNVRLLVEGGSSNRNSWSHAWKEVFRGTPHPPSSSRHETIEEIRKVRNWMREVGDMAGRGWSGLGYTFGKDLTGFAVFFAIFDITRRIAVEIKTITNDAMCKVNPRQVNSRGSFKNENHLPQFLHGMTLVAGGVIAGLSYEVIGRPWDVARQAARLNLITKQEYRSPFLLVTDKIRHEGFLCLFRDPTVGSVDSPTTSGGSRRRIYNVLRTLARVDRVSILPEQPLPNRPIHLADPRGGLITDEHSQVEPSSPSLYSLHIWEFPGDGTSILGTDPRGQAGTKTQIRSRIIHFKQNEAADGLLCAATWPHDRPASSERICISFWVMMLVWHFILDSLRRVVPEHAPSSRKASNRQPIYLQVV